MNSLNSSVISQANALASPLSSMAGTMRIGMDPIGFRLNETLMYKGDAIRRRGFMPFETMLRSYDSGYTGRPTLHPLFLSLHGSRGRDESSERVEYVWSVAQSALLIDGSVERDDNGAVTGQMAEELKNLDPLDRDLAEGLVAEHEAGQDMSEEGAYLAQADHIHAGRKMLGYILESGISGRVKRHLVSRATFHSLSICDYDVASDLLAISAEMFKGEGVVEGHVMAAEDLIRAALASALSGQSASIAADHIRAAIDIWGAMGTQEFAVMDAEPPAVETIDEARRIEDYARWLGVNI